MPTLIILLLVSFSAYAEPWVLSGQTRLDVQDSIDNPQPASAGAIGQITSLPYIVPEGKQVCITAYGIEGYAVPGIAVLFIWTGNPYEVTPQWRIDHALPSVAAKDGSNEFTELNFCFNEETYINVRLINGQDNSAVYGWYVTGKIIDTHKGKHGDRNG